MSDSTSGPLFARMLTLVLAPDPTRTPRDVALEILQETQTYDFSLNDLYLDDLLAKHDLARRRYNPQWKEWEIVYAGERGFDTAEPFSEASLLSTKVGGGS